MQLAIIYGMKREKKRDRSFFQNHSEEGSSGVFLKKRYPDMTKNTGTHTFVTIITTFVIKSKAAVLVARSVIVA